MYESLLGLFHLINGDQPARNRACAVPRCNEGLFDSLRYPELDQWRVGEQTLALYPAIPRSESVLCGHGPVFWSEIGRLETPAHRNVVFRPRAGQVRRQRPSGPIKEEGVVPKLFRRYPNLYGDLSDWNPWNALARDPEYGPKFLTEFQDRLLFGTDICFFDMPFPMVDLLREWRDTKKIREEVFNKVARENAVNLLGLK